MKKYLISFFLLLTTLYITSVPAAIITIDGSLNTNKNLDSQFTGTSLVVTANKFTFSYNLGINGGDGSIEFFSPDNPNCRCHFDFHTKISPAPELVQPSEEVLQQSQFTTTTIKGSTVGCLSESRKRSGDSIKQINCLVQTLELNSKNNDKAILTIDFSN
jgi:hypothetical protein